MNSTADVRAKMHVALWRRRVSAAAPRARFCCGRATGPRGCSIPDQHCVGWSRLRRPSIPPSRGNVAAQVSATSARKIRRYDKPIRIPAGLCHRHYSSRWRHHRNGNLFPCSPVWASPDLAHEPSPRIHPLLGRALCTVRGKLR
jgi:hypothetical protein